MQPIRFAPEQPFPPYSYVPGKFPHPFSDPAGHSYGSHPIAAIEADWQHSTAYRFGLDLFNHGYYWEAHEDWEGVWKQLGRSGVAADFLKGLIKLAAAGVKAREGNAIGIERHARRAEQLFHAVSARQPAPQFCGGLELAFLVQTSADIAAHAAQYVNSNDAPVVRVFPMTLLFRDTSPTLPDREPNEP